MDTEGGAPQAKLPAACGGPLVKIVVLGSLVGAMGLLGLLLGLHFSGHLSSPQDGGAEASSALSAGPVVSGANQARRANGTRDSLGEAAAASALADPDAAGDVDDAIKDLVDKIQDIIDKVSGSSGGDGAADQGDMPVMNIDLDISDELRDSEDVDGLEDGLRDELGDSMEDITEDGGEGFEDLWDGMEDLSDEAVGDLGDGLEEGIDDGLVKLGDGLGDSSESLEDLGEGLEGFGDLGQGFGDLDDSLGTAMGMSSMFNNNAMRPRQNAQPPPQQRNLNPFGLLLLTGDGFDFDDKKR